MISAAVADSLIYFYTERLDGIFCLAIYICMQWRRQNGIIFTHTQEKKLETSAKNRFQNRGYP